MKNASYPEMSFSAVAYPVVKADYPVLPDNVGGLRLVEHSVRSDDVTRLQLGPQLRQRELRRVTRPVVHPPAPDREGYPVQADRHLIFRPGVLPHVLELEPEAPDLTLRRPVVGRGGFHVVDLEIVDVEPDPNGTGCVATCTQPRISLPSRLSTTPEARMPDLVSLSRSALRPTIGSPGTGLDG